MEDRSCTVASRADLLPQREFRCQWCRGKVYKSRARYHGHMKSVHYINTEPDSRVFNCYHCPCSDCRYHKHASGGVIVFRDIAQLRRHYQRHHMTKNLKCDVCEREFGLERELFLHICSLSNTVTAEASPEHVSHEEVPKNNTGKEYCLLSALRLFRNNSKAVDQQHANHQEHEKENKPSPNGRQMQKCNQCKRKYIMRHRCSEHPCQKCGRVFFGKSALEHHMRRSTHTHLRVEDKSFVDEVLQLLSSIEDGTVRDQALLKEFAELLPVLQKIQGPGP